MKACGSQQLAAFSLPLPRALQLAEHIPTSAHPRIIRHRTGWGHAEALIYTHKVDGLTRSDAVLAARFEAMDAKNPYGAFVTDR